MSIASSSRHRTANRFRHCGRARLQQALPEGVLLNAQGTETAANRRMLAAFRWNLRMLSYIALLVGAFLIYNAVSVSGGAQARRYRHHARPGRKPRCGHGCISV